MSTVSCYKRPESTQRNNKAFRFLKWRKTCRYKKYFVNERVKLLFVLDKLGRRKINILSVLIHLEYT